MINKNNIFEGADAMKAFLTPGALGYSPIVELPASINPFTGDKVRIFIKLTQMLPLANIKSLPAYAMLNAVPKNQLEKIENLVEYSSGNTVLSLAVLSRHFGIPHLHAIITPDVPEHKKRLLRLVGANLLVSHGPPSPGVFDDVGGIHDAVMMGKKTGWHNLHQYINPSNAEASTAYIGTELWQQLGKRLSLFVASIGTAGTITGAGSFLKSKYSGLKIVGAAIKKNSSIPGPRGEVMIHKLGIDWKGIVDEVAVVNTRNAFEKSLELIRLGLFVGPSTGMQLSVVLAKLKEYKKKNMLNSLRNEDGEIVCCFIACDTMFPYIDDYFSVLPSKFFSVVKDL